MAYAIFVAVSAFVILIAAFLMLLGLTLLAWNTHEYTPRAIKRRRAARKILLSTLIGVAVVVGGGHTLFWLKFTCEVQQLEAWLGPELDEIAALTGPSRQRRGARYEALRDEMVRRYGGRQPVYAEALDRVGEFAYDAGDYKWAVEFLLRDAGPSRGSKWSLLGEPNLVSQMHTARAAFEVGPIPNAIDRLTWVIRCLRDPLDRDLELAAEEYRFAAKYAAGQFEAAAGELQRIAARVRGRSRFRWADVDLAVKLAELAAYGSGSDAVLGMLLTMLGRDAPDPESQSQVNCGGYRHIERADERTRAKRLIEALGGVYTARGETARADACRRRITELEAEAVKETAKKALGRTAYEAGSG